jgi:lipopolysaccharide biosynthesis glycosyltransferase
MNNLVHIAISPDSNYFKHGLVMLNSLLCHNSEKKFFLHVLDGGLSLWNKVELYFFCKKKKLAYKLYKVDYITIRKAPVTAHISMAAYCRIFMSSILPQQVSRVLYLDCDLIVLQKIDDLLNTNLSDNYVAAVRETIAPKDYERLGMRTDLPYFNSGVLLMNLLEWRKNSIEKTLVNFINSHPEKILYWDQDVLNYCFQKKWIQLSYNWNVTHFFFFPEKFPPEYFNLSLNEYNEVKENIKILHFTSQQKPWLKNCIHPLKEEYYKYRS